MCKRKIVEGLSASTKSRNIIRDLEMMFRAADMDGSGNLDEKELAVVLKVG